jgi:hypothetical protein
MWTQARIAFYITSGLAGLGTVLAMSGLATYDATAQTIDLAPISIPAIVGVVAPTAASALAAIAASLGWGRKA